MMVRKSNLCKKDPLRLQLKCDTMLLLINVVFKAQEFHSGHSTVISPVNGDLKLATPFQGNRKPDVPALLRCDLPTGVTDFCIIQSQYGANFVRWLPRISFFIFFIFVFRLWKWRRISSCTIRYMLQQALNTNYSNF